jgi:major inositol transporter-like SP family MFS transporter
VLLSTIGLSTTFLVFGVLGLIAIAFVNRYLPETKGKSLEELEYYFRSYGDQELQSKQAR